MNFTTLDPREVINASADALLLAMGHDVERPHPLARSVSNDGALTSIAYAAGKLRSRGGVASNSNLAVLGSGLTTQDFAEALAQAGSQIVFAFYGEQAQHLRFCGKVTAKNFKPFDVPGLGFDVVPQHLGPNAEILPGTVESVAGVTGLKLTVYGRTLQISRTAIINNDAIQIDRLFSAFGAAAARLEAQLVAQALESTDNMDDGQPVFHANFGNVGTAGAFNSASVAEAMKLLRKQHAPGGQYADLRMRHLVVEPELESTARRLVIEEGHDVEVTAMADLPAGRWYALADQKLAPTIAVIRLSDAPKPLRVERIKRPIDVDGTCVKGVADLGATVLGRLGIVRGGT